jgi:hypothetical protein
VTRTVAHVPNIYSVVPQFKVDFIRIFLDGLDTNARIRGATCTQRKLCNLGDRVADRIDDLAGRARIAFSDVLVNFVKIDEARLR